MFHRITPLDYARLAHYCLVGRVLLGRQLSLCGANPEAMNLACKQDVVQASGFFVMVWCVILELKRSTKETLTHLDRCDIQLSCYRPFSTVYAFYHILHM